MKKFKLSFNTLLIMLLLFFVVFLFIKYPVASTKFFQFGMGMVLIFSTIMIIKSSRESSKNPNSFFEIISLIFICIIMVPMSLVFIYMPFKDNISKLFNIESEVEADGFTIDGYTVILDVGLDNRVDVTERIQVEFYEKGHHGIYKFTPNWLEYTGKDGKTIKRKSEVLFYRAEGDNYKTEIENGKEKIRIGNEHITVFGPQEYEIKYTYDMGVDPFNNFDEFIFHAFGDYWGTEIKNPMIIINMPKEIDNTNINVFTDKYRKNNVNHLVNIEQEGNSINITSKDLKVMKALTVDIELPDNYFVGGSYNYGWLSFIISMIILGITGYILYMWSKYGRNSDKMIPTIEFYSPDNLNSAEIGYVYNKGKINRKLTVSLIVQLASKGYIKIDEIKGKNKKGDKIQITNLHPNTQINSTLTMNEKRKKNIELTPQFVVKRLNSNQKLTKNEEKVYKSLFGDDSFLKTISVDDNNFINVKDSLVNKGYIEILKGQESNKNNCSNLKQNKNTIEINDISLPALDEMEKFVYDKLFISENVIILSEHNTLYEIFNNTDKLLNEEFNRYVYDRESQEKRKATLIFASISLLLSFISFFEVEDMNPSMQYIYLLAFGCVIADYLFAFIMVKRTKYGEEISARVKGFREFLMTAEKEKLESLVENNPNYFYDILPYTYVLNISKKWIEKFQDIKMPENNMGNVDYLNGEMLFSSIVSNVSFPSNSGSSGSGGCSSCGGGCSSCGGGCSSCGGGGSW